MSISLIFISWNGYWDQYGKSITENINNFNTQPDEIIVVSDVPIDTSEINCTNIKNVIAKPGINGYNYGMLKNVGVKNASCEWIVFLDLDDIQNPQYLDSLDDSADIHGFSFILNGYAYIPNEKSLEARINAVSGLNMIPGTSAFKRHIFDMIDFEYGCYEDHIFYSMCYKLNLKVAFDNIIRFTYTGFHKSKNHEEMTRIGDIYRDTLLGNRSIYCFWFGNEMTENRLRNLQIMKDSCGVNLVLINDESFYDYNNEEIPIHPGFKHLSAIQKSDYARAYIMYFYGGGYSDIKENKFDWNEYFDKLFLSKASMIGYAEKSFNDLGNFWHDQTDIKNDVMQNYEKFIGMGHFIFKPKTQICLAWLLEIHSMMNSRYAELEKNPGIHPYNIKGGAHHSYKGIHMPANNDYPFIWAELGGITMHKMQYIFGLQESLPGMPYANMNNYR